MRTARRQTVLLAVATLLAACRQEVGQETAVRAGTGMLDETAFAIAAGDDGGAPVAGGPASPGPGQADATGPTAAGPGVGPGPGSGSAGGSPGTTPPKTATTTSAGPASKVDLERLMVTDGPPGYEREDDDDVDTGRIDFEDAVEDEAEDDSEEFFRRHGFEGGWDRAWSRGEWDEEDEDSFPVELYDTVYRFRAASGATAYRDRVTEYLEGSAEEEDVEVTTFTVQGVPGAKGYAASDPEFGSGAFVVFTKDGYCVTIESSEETVEKAREAASFMARSQYGRL